ncbi:hypothetical protein [Haloarchaeobius sp. HRN-SO-5]|uniref:hypothetical protein n=1 Tax=Haloarchaeobius sp. HRN-SO-5 TaxID=3446118 RepID=UPI003EBC1B43
MSDGTVDITRWLIEQADPDFDEETVDHLVPDEEAEVQGVVGEADGEYLVRIKSSVEENSEQVEYTIDLSESLLRRAMEEVEDTDVEFAE